MISATITNTAIITATKTAARKLKVMAPFVTSE